MSNNLRTLSLSFKEVIDFVQDGDLLGQPASLFEEEDVIEISITPAIEKAWLEREILIVDDEGEVYVKFGDALFAAHALPPFGEDDEDDDSYATGDSEY